ncbi:motility protein MotB, partial [Pseudomonas sp. CrR25]|nr:motility protein MotB [Pseudomonas sp. CrR25]
MENNQPIIVKRVKKVAGGHHGGAWKIAFADFATAMMAFFLVMWLMSSASPEQKKLISGYFKDPIGFSESA